MCFCCYFSSILAFFFCPIFFTIDQIDASGRISKASLRIWGSYPLPGERSRVLPMVIARFVRRTSFKSRLANSLVKNFEYDIFTSPYAAERIYLIVNNNLRLIAKVHGLV